MNNCIILCMVKFIKDIFYIIIVSFCIHTGLLFLSDFSPCCNVCLCVLTLDHSSNLNFTLVHHPGAVSVGVGHHRHQRPGG